MPAAVLAAWGPAVLWMAGIFIVSHQPVVVIPFGAPDYVAHGLSYAVLGSLLTGALGRWRLPAMTWRIALVATVLGALYGLTDEYHQSFIAGRDASVSDLVADAVGSFVGACAVAVVGALRRARSTATRGRPPSR